MQPLGLVKVETYNAIESVANEWEDLAERAGTPPWLRPDWTAAWWRAFGKGHLEIVALRTDGRLAALIPLVRRARALSSPTNWHTPDFRLVAEDDDAKRSLVETLFSGRRRRIALGFLDPADVAVCRPVAERAGYRLLERTLECPPYLRTEGELEAYERSLNTRMVSEARRRRRRLGEQGDLTFELEDGRDRLDALLEEGFRVEASGWKGEAGTAIVSHEETRRFYAELARFSAERGWLRLAFLRLDGHAIAFQFLVEHGGVISQLKGGFDEAYRKFAPGTLLVQDVIRRAFEVGAERYEFLGSEEGFKLEWATATHERQLLQAFAPSAAGAVDRAAFAYGRPLAKRAFARIRG